MAIRPENFLTPFPDPLAGGDRIGAAITRVAQAQERQRARDQSNDLGWARLGETIRHHGVTEDETAEEHDLAQTRHEDKRLRELEKADEPLIKELRHSYQTGDRARASSIEQQLTDRIQRSEFGEEAPPPPPEQPTNLADILAQADYAAQVYDWQEKTGMGTEDYEQAAREYEEKKAAHEAMGKRTYVSPTGRKIEFDPGGIQQEAVAQSEWLGRVFEKYSPAAALAAARTYRGTGDIGKAIEAGQEQLSDEQQQGFRSDLQEDRQSHAWGLERFKETGRNYRAREVTSRLTTSTGVRLDIAQRKMLESRVGNVMKRQDMVGHGEDMQKVEEAIQALERGNPLDDAMSVATAARKIGGGGNIAIYEQRKAEVGGVPEKFESWVSRVASGLMGEKQRQIMLESFRAQLVKGRQRALLKAKSGRDLISNDKNPYIREAADAAFKEFLEVMIPGATEGMDIDPAPSMASTTTTTSKENSRRAMTEEERRELEEELDSALDQ